MKDKIDINIGSNYLSSWKESDAIKELIANARDESEYEDIVIKNNEDGSISIINRGSEISPEHFMMQETNKHLRDASMGHFGVGLKDAIGVLYNKKIDIEIETSSYKYYPKYFNKSILVKEKCIFIIVDKNERAWKGTEVKLKNCSMAYVEEAKNSFLYYNLKNNKEEIILTHKQNKIINRQNDKEKKNIYLNGIKIGDSGTYLYSYDIGGKETYKNKKVSRDRNSINADNYIEEVKEIILSLKYKDKYTGKDIIDEYWNQLFASSSGSLRGELVNIDILAHIIKEKYKTEFEIRVIPPGSESYLRDYEEVNNMYKYKYVTLLESHIKKLESKIKNEEVFETYRYIRNKKSPSNMDKLTVEKLVNYLKKYFYDYIDKYEKVESIEYNLKNRTLSIPMSKFGTNNILNFKHEINIIIDMIIEKIEDKDKINILKNIINKLVEDVM